ncbi:MAG: hypothetical protein MRY83_00430, partial [Flavobacteriales bacterium]|nr:hypothetical protein [Flavobacteriales bacterium]
MKTTITLRWNLLYAMLLFNMISFGQYFDETYYLHNYSAEHFELRGVAQTGNGEYGAVVRRTAWGSGTLPYYTANFKIDANGDTLFTKATSDFYAGPWRVAHDNVNSRIITTKSHGLVAYDYNMDTVWTQTVSTTTVINNSVLALNNQYVLSGYEYATLPHAPYFAKFDLNGNELFYKEFNFESYHQQGVDVTENQQIPGGVVLLVNAPADFKLYATDTNGDTTWTKAYDKSIYGSPKRIINETSGGYLVLSQLGLNAVVSSIDALGAVNWSKIVAQNIWNTVDITEKDNHLYVLNEGAANNGNNQLAAAMCLSKSNNTGDTLWVKTYQSSTAGRYPAQILPSIYNDGVVIAGNDSVQPFGTTGIGVWRPFITAMDSSGTVDTCNGLEVTIHPTVTEDTLTAIISGGTQPYAPQYM